MPRKNFSGLDSPSPISLANSQSIRKPSMPSNISETNYSMLSQTQPIAKRDFVKMNARAVGRGAITSYSQAQDRTHNRLELSNASGTRPTRHSIPDIVFGIKSE